MKDFYITTKTHFWILIKYIGCSLEGYADKKLDAMFESNS